MGQNEYSRGLRRRFFIGGITAAVSMIVVVIGLLLGGRSYLQHKLSGWHEWANFNVPHDPVPLHSRVNSANGKVTICNEDSSAWMHPLIRITDDYLATVRRIDSGECKVFALDDFRTNSWKRMPPPRDLTIKKVEILADIDRKGYSENPIQQNASR